MNVYELNCQDLQGNDYELSQRSGQVTLCVNVASECGFTKQYSDLQKLHDMYKDRGFTVMGFPCNDFGGQEPGDAAEIVSCATSHDASFPLMSKVTIKEESERSDFYAALAYGTGALPAWNFGKYLVDKDGKAVAFFGSPIDPLAPEVTGRIEELLG